MNMLKLLVFALAAAFAGTAALAARPASAPREQAQGSAGFSVVDDFLDNSRRYLGL